MTIRPRLTPAIADVRRAVRGTLAAAGDDTPGAGPGEPPDSEPGEPRVFQPAPAAAAPAAAAPADRPLVLVALSGGADSLALAAATAFEAPRLGLRAGAVIVDHALQESSAEAAAAAARIAASLGLAPVHVRRVSVAAAGGPEAAARDARYAALNAARAELGAAHVLLGHTLDDQAETVLLGLSRGSGAASLWGMERFGGVYLRPLLATRRAVTERFCADSGLSPWHDPQNDDPAFARVRVRRRVLPVLESELGPGIAEALARTAAQLREDAEALDHFAAEMIEELAEPAEAGISLPVVALAANPPALRQRLIRLAVQAEFHQWLSRAHTLEVARLVTEWHGQGPLALPGIRVERRRGLIVFSAVAHSDSLG